MRDLSKPRKLSEEGELLEEDDSEEEDGDVGGGDVVPTTSPCLIGVPDIALERILHYATECPKEVWI